MENKLLDLIKFAGNILITSHIGPDGDAVSSSLLLFDILMTNLPDKHLLVALEEEPFGLNFLNNVDKIKIGPLAEIILDYKPDLTLILDANTVDRLSRKPETVREALKKTGSRIAIIDHHEPVGVEPNDMYINNQSPAVTLDIYEIFIKKLGLKKPARYAQTALTGIYTDTGGFINRNLNFDKTFEVVPELIRDGADLETIANRQKQISTSGAKVLTELMNNMRLEDGYIFSSISDEVAGDKANLEAVRQATDVFRSEILRNIEGRPWGFIVYRDVLADGRVYSASFRALAESMDVSKFATKLGGGGHKPAAGAKFGADNLEDALAKVQAIIKQTA